MNINKILFNRQHGFKANHSCETALHEIISDLIETSVRNKLVILPLFIDFQKAFDLVDSKLLLKLLEKLGFDEKSLNLISNYLSERTQIIKLSTDHETVYSDGSYLKLGVLQGSVLGPLFFSIFINDLSQYLNEIKAKMFADDITLYLVANKYNVAILKFQKIIDATIGVVRL